MPVKVIRADILGYCMGVRRAVETAERALCEYPDRDVYTLGPLIHNTGALEKLAERGLKVLKEHAIQNVCTSQSVVIIRAHGIPPQTLEKLHSTGCTVIDASCPRVAVSQKRAREYALKGWTIIIAGDKNHGEVAGIAGYAGETCILLENRDDAERLESVPGKAVLIGQTTISRAEYNAIAEVLTKKNAQLKVFNTICPATTERQAALEKMSKEVDGILVIGGRHSANTRRLLTTASQLCAHAALIENADEIPPEFFHLDAVGLTAGASTPDDSIDEVEKRLLKT